MVADYRGNGILIIKIYYYRTILEQCGDYYNMSYEKCCEKKNRYSKNENMNDSIGAENIGTKKCRESSQDNNSTENVECDNQEYGQQGAAWQGDLECCKQLADIQEKYAHMTADFNNFRLRIEKEKMQWSINAQLDIIKKLLPTIDMFDRAFQESAKAGVGVDDQALIGFSMIHKNFLKTLAAIGVEPMNDYAAFDPNKHEAIMQVESPEHKSDDIVEVLEKGYMFKGAVVRPAKVSVAR